MPPDGADAGLLATLNMRLTQLEYKIQTINAIVTELGKRMDFALHEIFEITVGPVSKLPRKGEE
jgi:hypothetical protein